MHVNGFILDYEAEVRVLGVVDEDSHVFCKIILLFLRHHQNGVIEPCCYLSHSLAIKLIDLLRRELIILVSNTQLPMTIPTKRVDTMV